MMVKSFSKIFNFPFTIVRPSALYGERCVSRRVGQIFIENALQNKDIIINGDGKDKLDFTYIKDLINGVYKIVLNKNSKNQIFNLTYGKGRSIQDLIKILKKNFPEINVKFSPREKFMPKRGGLSVSKARRLIGYKPKYTIEKRVSRRNWSSSKGGVSAYVEEVSKLKFAMSSSGEDSGEKKLKPHHCSLIIQI